MPEAVQFPALAQVLQQLNVAASPVWTSKCDLWPHLEADEFAPDEWMRPGMRLRHRRLHRPVAQGAIDNGPSLPLPLHAKLMHLLHEVRCGCCRVDLVIRRAFITPELMGFGITAYLTSCGQSEDEAAVAFQAALSCLYRCALQPIQR